MATGIQQRRKISEMSDFTISYEGKKLEQDILFQNSCDINKVMTVGNLDDFENKLYFGENLDVLLSLLNDDNVKGKVKLVYIDPPYATNSIFVSRNQEHAYSDRLVGSNFLEFLRERLIILRELLAEDGAIYVHLDNNMAFEVKVIMDEIFGKSNFQNFITRQKCNRKNSTTKKYGNISDYILFYSKNKNYVWNRSYEKWSEEDMLKQYPFIEEGTGRRYKRVPIHAPGVRNGETGKEWRGMLPPKGKHWQYTPTKLDEFDAKGEIYWSSNGNPRRKVYFENSKGIPVQDIWSDVKDVVNQNDYITGYPTEKAFSLLERIVKASSNEGDLILDCFAGSGTTLAAAEKNRRKWIGIDSSLLSIETIIKRLAYGSKPMGDYVTGKDSAVKQLSLLENPVLNTGFSLYSVSSQDNKNEMIENLNKWESMFN